MRVIGTDTRTSKVKFLGNDSNNPTYIKTGESHYNDDQFEELSFRPIIELTFKLKHWWNIKSGMEIIVTDISGYDYHIVNDTIFSILNKLISGEIQPVNEYITLPFVIEKKGYRYSLVLHED